MLYSDCRGDWYMNGIITVPNKAVTHGPKHHFFGYYDVCPWDESGRYMLAMEVDFAERMPKQGDIATIGVIDLEREYHFEPVAQTRAWNWQLGARAQWVPSTESGRCIIYNDCVENQLVSIILDISTGKMQVLNKPIYALSPDGHFALSVNFGWLHRVRIGYGYECGDEVMEFDPENDGIYLVDLSTGKFKLIISYSQVIEFRKRPVMVGARKHWIEHLLINPDCTRFLFMHRFETKDGYYTRMFTANVDGSELFLVAEGKISHYCWRNARQILAWSRIGSVDDEISGRTSLGLRLLRKVWNWTPYHLRSLVRQRVLSEYLRLFDDRSGEWIPVAVGIIRENPHMSFSRDGVWLLGDTYPDNKYYRTLFIYNWETQQKVVLGRFYSPPNLTGPARCDLHPRWSPDGRFVCIDSAHEGSRQMYVLDVSRIVKT